MANNFTVVSIAPRVRSVAGSTFEHVQEVTFTTIPSNIPGTVDIADADFNPAGVTAIITPVAANLEAVKAL